MKTLLFTLAFLLMATSIVPAAPVALDPFLPPAYPYFIGPASPNFEVFAFTLPNYANVASVNTIHVRADVFDDSSRDRPEGFRLVLDVPGLNVDLASFGDDLGGTLGALDPATAYTVEHHFSPFELGKAEEVLDLTAGVLLVRVNHNDGDFFLNDLTVTADVNYVPEPSTFGLAGLAIVAALAAKSRSR